MKGREETVVYCQVGVAGLLHAIVTVVALSKLNRIQTPVNTPEFPHTHTPFDPPFQTTHVSLILSDVTCSTLSSLTPFQPLQLSAIHACTLWMHFAVRVSCTHRCLFLIVAAARDEPCSGPLDTYLLAYQRVFSNHD